MTDELAPAHSAVSLVDLPHELLVAILDFASRGRRLHTSLGRYMRVCKAFCEPASRLLHRALELRTPDQAMAYCRVLRRSPSPSRLTASSRRLSISYAVSEGQATVPPELAYTVLSFMERLNTLRVYADDDLKLVRSAGTNLSRLRTPVTSAVRWDNLVRMMAESHQLAILEVTGLYNSTSDSGVAPVAASGSTADASPVPASTPKDFTDPSDVPYLEDMLDAATGDGDFAPLARPYSTVVPPPCKGPPAFPCLPLRRLILHAPKLDDGHFISLLAACRDTLEALVLDKADFSNRSLVVALRLVPNLLELELDGCTFSDDDASGHAGPQGFFAPRFPPPPRRASAQPSVDTTSFPVSLGLFAPGTATRRALNKPLEAIELRAPLANLSALCPFLHVLVLASDDLVPPHALSAILGTLPLERFEVGIKRPVIKVAEVTEGLGRAGGRLETLVIRKETPWTQEELDEVVRFGMACGTVVGGEAGWSPPAATLM